MNSVCQFIKRKCIKSGSLLYSEFFSQYSRWCIDENKRWMNSSKAKQMLKRWLQIKVTDDGWIQGWRWKGGNPIPIKMESSRIFLKYCNRISPDGSGSKFVFYENLEKLYKQFCQDNALVQENLKEKLELRSFVINKDRNDLLCVYGLTINPPKRLSLFERLKQKLDKKLNKNKRNYVKYQVNDDTTKIDKLEDDVEFLTTDDKLEKVEKSQTLINDIASIKENKPPSSLTLSKFIETYTEKGGCVNFDTFVQMSGKTNAYIVRELKKLGYPIVAGTILGLSLKDIQMSNVDVFIYASPMISKESDGLCDIAQLKECYSSFCSQYNLCETSTFTEDLRSLKFVVKGNSVIGIRIVNHNQNDRNDYNFRIKVKRSHSYLMIQSSNNANLFEVVEKNDKKTFAYSFDIKAGAIANFAQRLRSLDESTKWSDLSYIIVRDQLYKLEETENYSEVIKTLKEWNLLVVYTPLMAGQFIVSKATYENLKHRLLLEEMKQTKTKSAKEVASYRLLRNKHPDLVNQYKLTLKDGTVYNVDMFSEKDNTVIEFLGDFFHGNPEVFEKDELNTMIEKTFGQLYDETMKRLQAIKDNGYITLYIWENDWDKRDQKLQYPSDVIRTF